MHLPQLNRWGKVSLAAIVLMVVGWMFRRYLWGVFFLLFFLLTQICRLIPPPQVQNVVSEGELSGSDWNLSPDGDRMFYDSRAGGKVANVVMFLPTKQKQVIDRFANEGCSGLWLDNTNLYCGSYIFATDDFTTIPLKNLDAADVSLELLSQAEVIYLHLKDNKLLTNVLIVTADDYKHNLEQNFQITNITDTEHILTGYEYVTFPVPHEFERNEVDKKIYSPNGLYYYVHSFPGHLVIYDAKTDEQLSEFQGKDALSFIYVGGWAWDSSGVYFEVSLGGFLPFWKTDIGGINKLKVPQGGFIFGDIW